MILVLFGIFYILQFSKASESSRPNFIIDCSTLRMGQYLCPDPDPNYVETMVDPKTQELRGCTQENKARSRYTNLTHLLIC